MSRDLINVLVAGSAKLLSPVWAFGQKPRRLVVSAATVAFCMGVGSLLITQQGHANRVALSDVDCLIEPSMVVELGTAVPGLLDEVVFDRNDFVKRGAVMAKLESSVEVTLVEIASQIASSNTGVKLRQQSAAFGVRTQQRNQELLASKTISTQTMDQVSTETRIAELQLQQEQEAIRLAKLELARAKATLNRRYIKSPISGTVTQRYRHPGEFIDSDPVFQIAQLNPLHVEVLLPLSELGSVSVGSNVDVRLDVPGFDDEVFNGEVHRIDSVADAASGTYGVRVELANPEYTIPSGVRCLADFHGS